MQSVKLTFANGHRQETEVNNNATIDGVNAYFLGQFFDIGQFPEEKLDRCIKVEFDGRTFEYVTGQNGYTYCAEHISGNLYVIGKFVVIVKKTYVQETVCRATKKNLEEIKNRGRTFR